VLDSAAAARWIRNGDGPATVGEWRDEQKQRIAHGVDPEAIWALEEVSGYEVRIGWSGSGDSAEVDVLFRRRTPGLRPLRPGWQRLAGGDDLPAHANQPRQNDATRQLLPTLRAYLRERLPEYMLPAFLVVLDSFPLTANGKIDRARLPAPTIHRETEEGGFVGPRTQVEQRIARMWESVLGLDAVGVHDNFFDLGGHSLLMVRFHGQLCNEFGMELSVTDLFRYPTVSALAAFLGADPNSTSLAPIDDRAGKHRGGIDRRAANRNHGSIPAECGITDKKNGDDLVPYGLHPSQVTRLQEALKWRMFRSG
jgi:acyl carrier protein